MTDTATKTPEEIAAEQAAADAKAATDAATAAAESGTGKTVEDLQAELDTTARELRAANTEAAIRRRRLKELEDAETERAQAEMTEVEKLKTENETAAKRAAAAEEQAKETLVRAAFVAEAVKASVAHPEDVYLLADRSAVSVDEAGKVEGVAEAVKALVDAGRLPLAGKAPAPSLDGGAGNGDRGKGAVKLTADELEAARRMNIAPEKYAAQKAALMQEQQAT